MYQVAIHFPDGTVNQCVDFRYAMTFLRKGEAFIIEREPRRHGSEHDQRRYRIEDIQHQFRATDSSSGPGLVLIMTNVILVDSD